VQSQRSAQGDGAGYVTEMSTVPLLITPRTMPAGGPAAGSSA